MSSNVIDYFATLGRKNGMLKSKNFRPIWAEENDKDITASDLWNSAITDVAIVFVGTIIELKFYSILSEF